MPGNEPKAHHYVHRAYLEGFADVALASGAKKSLWVYIPRKQPFPQATDRVAKRNYYYCYQDRDKRQFHVEHSLQKLEDATLPPLIRLRQHDFNLSEEDRLLLAGYAALSYVRVPTFERTINRITALVEAKKLEFVAHNRSVLTKIVKEIAKESGESIGVDDYYAKLTGGDVYVTQANRAWSMRQMIQVMMGLQNLIFHMHWCFLRAPQGDDGFLTSDNPVSLFDTSVHAVGFASSPDAHFTFAISREVCLLATHRQLARHLDLNASQVRKVNRETMIRADGQVYAPFRSGAVQELFDRIVAHRRPPTRVMFRQGRVVEE